MADQHPSEGSSLSSVPGECSESTVELNVKTLDSRTHSFHVDKNVNVLGFLIVFMFQGTLLVSFHVCVLNNSNISNFYPGFHHFIKSNGLTRPRLQASSLSKLYLFLCVCNFYQSVPTPFHVDKNLMHLAFLLCLCFKAPY